METMLALALLLQEKVTIGRTEKEAYAKEVPKCEKAASLIDSDPAQAVEILDGVLENAKITEKECILRWMTGASDWSKWYDFFPYQYRGRARYNLALKAKDADLAQKAVDDLKKSVDKGVGASRTYLTTAEALQKQLSGRDPAADFRGEVQKLWAANKFADAKKLIESDRGAFLSKDQRTTLLTDTDRSCREYVDTCTQGFLRSLRLIRNVGTLERKSAADFDSDFELPAQTILVDGGVTEEYRWCLEARAALQSVRQKKDALDALFQRGVKAVAFGDAEPGWFLSVEGLAFEIVRVGIETRAAEAGSAAADRRKSLRQEADKLLARWQAFDAEVRKAAKGHDAFLRRIPARDLTDAFEGFPVDVGDPQEILKSIKATADSADPPRGLAELETRLEKMREEWSKMSVESRKVVVTYQVVVGALQGFFAGRTLDEVVSDLRSLAADLKGVGGPLDPKQFGPKVEKVFQRLAK